MKSQTFKPFVAASSVRDERRFYSGRGVPLFHSLPLRKPPLRVP